MTDTPSSSPASGRRHADADARSRLGTALRRARWAIFWERLWPALATLATAIGAPRIIADVVGPVCESGDYLALDRSLNVPKPGDLLAVMTAGAYGAVEASTYNTRSLVPEVLVRAGEWALVRPRVIVEELIALDRLPPWL